MARKWLVGLSLVLVSIPVGVYFYATTPPVPRSHDDGKIDPLETRVEPPAFPRTEGELMACAYIASLPVLPGQPFPSLLPWEPLRVIGQNKVYSLEDMLRDQPIAFLDDCLERYHQQVQGYRLTFLKRERINGKLQDPEVIRVHFREQPLSVHMDWKEGARLAKKSLFLVGWNKNNPKARPNVPFLPIMSYDKNGSQAKQSSRYAIDQFGMGFAIRSCLESMHAAEKNGTLCLTYQGQVKLEEVGNRVCYKFLRKPYDPPEEDGVNELTLYIDKETWLQVGAVVRDKNGDLIAEYFFRDIELNPTFDANQFTDKSL